MQICFFISDKKGLKRPMGKFEKKCKKQEIIIKNGRGKAKLVKNIYPCNPYLDAVKKKLKLKDL